MATSNNAHDFLSDFTGLDWLNTEEAAVYLRLLTKKGQPCKERLRNLVNKGRVPFYKPFGRLMFRRSELQKLIETSRQGTTSGNSKILR